MPFLCARPTPPGETFVSMRIGDYQKQSSELSKGHILHYISVISEALADIFLIFQNAQSGTEKKDTEPLNH